jgi:hypothetical protein
LFFPLALTLVVDFLFFMGAVKGFAAGIFLVSWGVECVKVDLASLGAFFLALTLAPKSVFESLLSLVPLSLVVLIFRFLA